MARNREILVLIGIPGSGKTTWGLEFLKKNSGWVKISRDDFRFMLRNEPTLDFKGETLVTEINKEVVRKSLLSGYNVLLDNTHCKLKYINNIKESFGDLADINYRYFDIPVKTAIERDSCRTKKVGEEVIKKMHENLTNMLQNFDFQPSKQTGKKFKDYTLNFKKELPYAIISDIDGTVAHMGNNRGPFDWKKVGLDDPDFPIIETLKAWKKSNTDIHLIMVSGRDESCRQETIDWLNAAGVPFDILFMRPNNDYRKDSLIKEEIYINQIKDKYNVITVFDDRQQVVDTWRNLGLKCIQCEPGNF